ncbi:unnamed protein product [Rotaria sp. Silwood1]|nr:unnamed protein product [Rotaria sp. Silwood1]
MIVWLDEHLNETENEYATRKNDLRQIINCLMAFNSVEQCFKSVQDVTKDQARFMWSQTLMKVLVELPQTNQSKQEFIEECRRQYKHNNSQQRQITEFEKTYSSSGAISWYTRNGFLYRIINKALQNEVLICMGAVFRIEFIDKVNEDIWHVKLISVDHNDYAKLDDLENYLKTETNTTFTCLGLGRILQKMGEYDQAQALYEILLAELPANHSDVFAIYNDLGMALFKIQKNPQITLNYLLQSLTLSMKTFPKYFLMFTQTMINICSVYSASRNSNRALSLLHLTLRILGFIRSNNAFQIMSLQKSETYNNIDCIYLKRGRLSLTLKYLKISLRIQKKYLPSNHPDIALTLNNIGMAYVQQFDNEKAYKYFPEGAKIVEESLPFEHHDDVAQLYNNMGLLEYNRNNFDKALICYEKARVIQLKCLPPIHWKIGILYNNIGLVYFEQAQYDMALNMFQESWNILQQCLLPDHPEICHAHINIGKTCRF